MASPGWAFAGQSLGRKVVTILRSVGFSKARADAANRLKTATAFKFQYIVSELV